MKNFIILDYYMDIFKEFIDNITDNTNINNNGEIHDLFDIDSAHDILFEKSLANVTTEIWGDKIPAGVSGEDRYVWYLQNDDSYQNVKYFGVWEKEDKNKRVNRVFFYIDDDSKLKMVYNGSTKTDYSDGAWEQILTNVTDHKIARTTAYFLSYCMFKSKDGDVYDKINDYFLYQTVHDAGKQLINTHMATVSNHIDSAGTPVNDIASNKTSIKPNDYNTPNEGKPTMGDEQQKIEYDKSFIYGSVMSNNGSDNDGNWAINSTFDKTTPLRPWYDTKYSLLIFKYIILPLITTLKPADINELNLIVTNFIWQLTLYFCFKSKETKDKYWEEAINYLRKVRFTEFRKAVKGKKIPYYSINSMPLSDNINKIQTYFNDWFGWDFEHGDINTPAEPFLVTQSLCADALIDNLNKSDTLAQTYSITGRNEGAEKKKRIQ